MTTFSIGDLFEVSDCIHPHLLCRVHVDTSGRSNMVLMSLGNSLNWAPAVAVVDFASITPVEMLRIAGGKPCKFLARMTPILINPKSEEWEAVCKSYVEDRKMVDAVRHCRDQTGWSLKDSKNYCERWRP